MRLSPLLHKKRILALTQFRLHRIVPDVTDHPLEMLMAPDETRKIENHPSSLQARRSICEPGSSLSNGIFYGIPSHTPQPIHSRWVQVYCPEAHALMGIQQFLPCAHSNHPRLLQESEIFRAEAVCGLQQYTHDTIQDILGRRPAEWSAGRGSAGSFGAENATGWRTVGMDVAVRLGSSIDRSRERDRKEASFASDGVWRGYPQGRRGGGHRQAGDDSCIAPQFRDGFVAWRDGYPDLAGLAGPLGYEDNGDLRARGGNRQRARRAMSAGPGVGDVTVLKKIADRSPRSL